MVDGVEGRMIHDSQAARVMRVCRSEAPCAQVPAMVKRSVCSSHGPSVLSCLGASSCGVFVFPDVGTSSHQLTL
jgi:hypothetical protein